MKQRIYGLEATVLGATGIQLTGHFNLTPCNNLAQCNKPPRVK